MPSDKGNSAGREDADFPDTTMNLDQQSRTEDTRAVEEVSLNTKASLGNDVQYTGEADRLQPRCLIKTSTTSSISADTVAALGGNEKAKSFIVSVAERFASQYSDQLEQQLQDACGNPKCETEPAHQSSEMIGIQDFSSGLVSDLHLHTTPHLTSKGNEEERSSKGKIVEIRSKNGDSYKKDSKHLEDYLETDWPIQSKKDFHAETKVQVDSGLESDPDTGSCHRDRDSIASEGYSSAESRAGSTDSDSSIVSTSDMKVVLRKLDEIKSDKFSGRVYVPYDPSARPVENSELLPPRHGKWALTLRRIFGSDNKTLKYCWLDIESRLILDVLEKIPLSQESGLRSTGSIYWPDDDIFRYREDIRTYALEHGELTVKHVNVLLQLVEEEYVTRINDLKTLLPNGSCNFEILREVFWNDDLVITKNKTRAYRLVDANVIGEPPPPDRSDRRYLKIDAVYVDFQGDRFGKASYEYKIHVFSGIKYIRDLPIFPLKYHPDAKALESRFLKRGKKFESLGGQRFRIHRGLVRKKSGFGHNSFDQGSSSSTEEIDDDMSGSGASQTENQSSISQPSTRVMVDAAAFGRYKPYERIKTSSLRYELIDGALTEQHLLISTDEVPVFSFRDKSFYMAPVDEIHDIVFNDKVFGQLVIPEHTKDLVRALVANHAQGGMDDFIEGKGQGLIILLHGPPGVGKTMTAEAVAEHTHRPLYAVTSGELGETSKDLESNLQKVLDRAKTFHAVLLLDEADVFIEQRTPQDLRRNALVSIFLRELEYYQGILFLTTNRAETFDHAFQSRIHLSISYSELDIVARERIWRAFGNRLAAQISDTEYAELAAFKLNGRQVKNIVSSATILASSTNDELSMKYLRTVIDIEGPS